MARVPDAVIERLKREVSLERLVTSSGVELKRRGKDLVGVCPFHDDGEASLIITPAKNLFHCMGCGAAGSTIDWVMKTQNVSFRHAVELLRKDFMPTDTSIRKRPPAEPLMDSPLEPDAEDHELATQVIDYYHQQLKQSPKALAYLEKRGLVHGEVIDTFKLGYADRTLAYLVPAKEKRDGSALRTKLQELGFYRQSGHEHLRGSLVIPIFDEAGNVAQAYGRKINERLRPGTPLHLYLPGEHRSVWNLAAVKACEEIILCEALIDALTFWVNGFRNVTTSYGIQGFGDYHLAAFQQHGVKRVLIAYDRDEPGDHAAAKLAEKLIAHNIECYRIQCPHGMDINDYALAVKPAPKSLEVLIRSAQWMGSGRGGQRPQSLVASPQLLEEQDKESSSTQADREAQQPLKAAKRKKVAVDGEPLADDQALPETQAHHQSSLAALAADTPDPSHADLATSNYELATVSPVPAMPSSDLRAVIQGEDIFISRGDRSYRVRNLEQNMSKNVMKVNLMAYRGDAFHMDVLNLYSAYHRAGFAKQSAAALGVKAEIIDKDLGGVLLKLEELQDAQIQEALKPKTMTVELTDAEKKAAIAFLEQPGLVQRILADFETCGIVGEETNKLAGYLVAISRKLPQPLGAMIQSSTASGKTTTMDAILAFVPKEDLVKYSAITGQALYYKGENDLRRKIIAIVEEEGAEKASYPLKLLLSEGELIIASTGKNQSTGNHATQDYHVKGPVAVFVTTTAVETDEEFQNRCLVLTVDESRAQTQAIHRIQRKKRTLEGLKKQRHKERLIKLHQNAQRLLRSIHVVNAYADDLTFLDDKTRTRRDQEKYLNLIEAIACLHQYQRRIRSIEEDGELVEYVEATLDDIALANELAHEVLGRSLDELPPQTRALLGLIHQMVSEACKKLDCERSEFWFSRRDVREYTRWSNTQLMVHMRRLEEMEYLLTHRGGRGQRFVYELLYNGEGYDNKPFLMGLLDVEKLRRKYEENRTGSKADLTGLENEHTGSKRAQNGVKTMPKRVNHTPPTTISINPLAASAAETTKNAYLGEGDPSTAMLHSQTARA